MTNNVKSKKRRPDVAREQKRASVKTGCGLVAHSRATKPHLNPKTTKP